MNRRVIAALLALMILLCALPVSALETADDYAACRVYEIGTIYDPYEKVWVQGRNAPDELDAGEGYHWEQYNRLYREGCGKTEHPRHTDECYDYVDGVYQLKYEHETHTHNIYCKVYDAQYLWHVVPNEPDEEPGGSVTPPEDPGDEPENPTVTTGKSGFEDDPGEISLIVQCVNADGDNLPNVGFRLVREKVDDEGKTVINEETGLPDLEPVAEDVLWTNSDGQVRFNALEDYEEDFSQPWLVVQDASAFIPGGEYYNVYYSNGSQWAVEIDSSRYVDVTLAKECGLLEREEQVVLEGYYDDVLTIVNDRISSVLDISVEFEGISKNEAQNGSFMVTVNREPDNDEFPKTLSFPADDSTRNYSWGNSLDKLSPGEYSITVEEPAAIEGYTYLDAKVELLNKDNIWEEKNAVSLGSEKALATFRITYFYEINEIPRDPQEDPVNTISIVTVDDIRKTISGAEYILTGADGSERLITEETGYVLDDLANVADAGKTYTLVQSKAPAGYHLSSDEYTVEISEKGDVILSNKNAPDDKKTSAEGWQIAQFVNTRKTAAISLTCEDVVANVDDGCWNLEQTRKTFESRSHTFRLSWKNDSGAPLYEDLVLLEGETKEFSAKLPLGTEYQVEALNDEVFACDIVETAIARVRSSGTVMAYQVTEEPVALTATITYTILPGEPMLNLTMRRVNDKDVPLAGSKLVLRDEKKTEIASYTTQTDGYIAIGNVFNMPGKTYTLTEEKSPDGYAALQGAIEIEIGLDYVKSLDGVVALKQVLKETVSHESVTAGDNGHYYIKTEGKGAQIKVVCDSVTANVDDRCWNKLQTQKDFEARKHAFRLFVKDGNGEWQSKEVLTLGKGESGVFETVLSYGTEYKVEPDNASAFRWEISDNTGIIGERHMGKTTELHARITYTIKRGDTWLSVYMRKVTYRGQRPLSDAKFVLRDEYDDTIETYVTKDDGHIDIEGVFNEPGRRYTLKEMKAPESYVKLNRPIEIEIGLGYELSGTGVLEQVLTEYVSHESVQQMSDGTYIIINKHLSDIPQTADTSNVHIWGAILLASTVTLVLITGSKMRRKRY